MTRTIRTGGALAAVGILAAAVAVVPGPAVAAPSVGPAGTSEFRGVNWADPKVYFEPMNEPFGYSLDSWVDLTAGWLDDHDDVPRGRVIISGTGYNDDVTGVGAAEELPGTLLSLHFYGYWANHTTEDEWKANLLPRLGEYGWRTIVSAAGSPMTTGLNYGNHEGDAYSLTEVVGDGDLEVTNASGLSQIQWGWGLQRLPALMATAR